MKKVGINGLGRIGRTSLRVWWMYHRQEISLDLINTSGSMEIDGWANLVKYDTNYGQINAQVRWEKVRGVKETTSEDCVIGYLFLDDHKITVTAQRDPALIPWGSLRLIRCLNQLGLSLTRKLRVLT